MEFPNHRDAVEAVKTTNNYKLDKSHTFVVNLFSDFEKYENIPTDWEPPVEEPCGVQQGVAEEKLEHYFFDSQSEIGETFGQREMIIF